MTEQELANVIWDIKEIIRNLYDDAEVEDVILPFTLLRRLDCVLDEHRDDIMKEMEAIKDMPAIMQNIKLKSLLKQHNLTFFNSSGLSLERLLSAPEQIATSFQTYLDGFTENIKDILVNFAKEDSNSETYDLSRIYSKLDRYNCLFAVTHLFVKRADLHPSKVSNAMMGTIFEMVIRYAKETTNAKAGQYYTPREIVQLLVSLTMCGKESELYGVGRAFSIYDPCCGTGGMLTMGREYLKKLSGREDLKVYLYGQELYQKTYAICKSDLLMKGEDQNLDNQLFCGDTLADDRLEGKTFNFMLANPPFGVDWGGKKPATKEQVLRDNRPGGRFEAGLPSTNDGSLLFLQHMIAKMDTQQGSRIGIVLNGSPLFNGSAGSGWSNIRKMLLDRNLLDCIVALPKNLFYGTDIATYLWILDNKRPANRKDKVLFINAAHAEYTKLLQKNLGKKRYEISPSGASDILAIYREYVDAFRDIVYEKTGEIERLQVAKLLDYDDFRYTTVATRRPLRYWFENITEKYLALCKNEAFDADSKKNAILKIVSEVEGIDDRRSDSDFFAFLKSKKVKYTATELKLLRSTYGVIDEEAPKVHENPLDENSNFVVDTNLNDTEKIPQKQDIDDYFEHEVLPFAPDAWMDRSEDKLGVEFPFTRIFYKYRPLRTAEAIMAELNNLDDSINL